MRATLVSLGAATVLAAVVAWAPLPGASASDAPGDAPPSAPAVVVAPQSIRASAASAYIGFAPQQAPLLAPGATLAPPKPKPGPPILVGLIGGGPRRIAYVEQDGHTTRAGLWDTVGKWRVTGIGPHGITLSAGRQSLALALYGPHPAPPTPTLASNENAPAPSAPTPVAAAAPTVHALEPASAPSAPRAPRGGGARYWSGPPGSAPPGFIVLKPGELPPQ
jgi:hypothetical protein